MASRFHKVGDILAGNIGDCYDISFFISCYNEAEFIAATLDTVRSALLGTGLTYDIVIIDEPTRGIDIGTKQQIYDFIQKLAASGKSVIVISSEMAEIIGLSHRVVVMRSGRITGVLQAKEINEDQIVRHAMGLEGRAAA